MSAEIYLTIIYERASQEELSGANLMRFGQNLEKLIPAENDTIGKGNLRGA